MSKDGLRRRAWSALEDAGVDRFPGVEGRIPNFAGAEEAAERLRQIEVWEAAATLKANPDSPQWPVRQRALEDGKVVYMAVPRLSEERPFFYLDPDRISTSPRRASSIKGASREGRTVEVEDLAPVDLVVVGSVAVARDGSRLGKGGGYSDLEFALARAAGWIESDTRIVTTVHEIQILEPGEIPMEVHDVPVDFVVTPERVIECDATYGRPEGIVWDALDEEKVDSIPLLERLRDERDA